MNNLQTQWQDIRTLLSSRSLYELDMNTVAVSLVAYPSEHAFRETVFSEIFRLVRKSVDVERKRFERGRSDAKALLSAMRNAQEGITDYLIRLRRECAVLDGDYAFRYFPKIIVPEIIRLYAPYDPIYERPGFEWKEEIWFHS